MAAPAGLAGVTVTGGGDAVTASVIRALAKIKETNIESHTPPVRSIGERQTMFEERSVVCKRLYGWTNACGQWRPRSPLVVARY
jgi:hypothetical protein